ncbi:MAG: hypothetical protein ACJA0S_000112 [Rickettsiales bacterium]|jgi:hypothetical protein
MKVVIYNGNFCLLKFKEIKVLGGYFVTNFNKRKVVVAHRRLLAVSSDEKPELHIHDLVIYHKDLYLEAGSFQIKS